MLRVDRFFFDARTYPKVRMKAIFVCYRQILLPEMTCLPGAILIGSGIAFFIRESSSKLRASRSF
jgi:hypothetical protein